ncbi:MAG: hypothetical protein AAF797_05330 [Planctomycetota bacterium]
MIFSSERRFIFFHNPKCGGTSVRDMLAPWHDEDLPTWGIDPEGTHDRTHIGIDEFAQRHPQRWAAAQGYKLCSLYRDPYRRFISAVFEHARNFRNIDIRYATPTQRRRMVTDRIEALTPLSQAEQVMHDPQLAHFRPQWIFHRSVDRDVTVKSFPVKQIPEMFAYLELPISDDNPEMQRNSRAVYTLPGPIAAMVSSRSLRRASRGLVPPRLRTIAKDWLHRRRSTPDTTIPPGERDTICRFVDGFYRTDFEHFGFPTETPELSV